MCYHVDELFAQEKYKLMPWSITWREVIPMIDPYNTDASHKHNVDWKKSDIKEDILHVAEFFSDPPRCLEPGRHISAPSYSVEH